MFMRLNFLCLSLLIFPLYDICKPFFSFKNTDPITEGMVTEPIISRSLAHLFITKENRKTNINSWWYLLFKSAVIAQMFGDSRGMAKLENYRHH